MFAAQKPVKFPKTNEYHEYPLKVDGWKMIHFLLKWSPFCSGHSLIFDGVEVELESHNSTDGVKTTPVKSIDFRSFLAWGRCFF